MTTAVSYKNEADLDAMMLASVPPQAPLAMPKQVLETRDAGGWMSALPRLLGLTAARRREG